VAAARTALACPPSGVIQPPEAELSDDECEAR
jgi:hypothetical protein